MSDALAIRAHYQAGTPAADALAEVERLLATLPAPPSAEALAGLDQFHLGGLAATRRLAALAAVARGAEVLDAGSGLGGPSRYLAEALGCHVTGLDLSPLFVAISRRLAEAAALAGRVRYETGDLLALPFPAASFDLVWTQHAAMNIADRDAQHTGIRRVLRPGGRFAFHDVLAVEGAAPPLYPTPWAETPGASHLLSAKAMGRALDRAGLDLAALQDVTAETLAGLAAAPPPAGGGLARVMGPRFPAMVANLARNLREGRLRVAMGVAVARP
jgi:SAM-dependent methyltransferase